MNNNHVFDQKDTVYFINDNPTAEQIKAAKEIEEKYRKLNAQKNEMK